MTGKATFPEQLYAMLDEAERKSFDHIISWLPSGHAFKIHQTKPFAQTILPRYFRQQTRYKSFSRQLNLYKFKFVKSIDECEAIGSEILGGYYHPMFSRANKTQSVNISRIKKNPRQRRVIVEHSATTDAAALKKSTLSTRHSVSSACDKDFNINKNGSCKENDPKALISTTATTTKADAVSLGKIALMPEYQYHVGEQRDGYSHGGEETKSPLRHSLAHSNSTLSSAQAVSKNIVVDDNYAEDKTKQNYEKWNMDSLAVLKCLDEEYTVEPHDACHFRLQDLDVDNFFEADGGTITEQDEYQLEMSLLELFGIENQVGEQQMQTPICL